MNIYTIGESGIGSYHGKHSFDAFSHKRSIYDSGIPDFLLGIRYPPYNDTKLKHGKRYYVKFVFDHHTMILTFQNVHETTFYWFKSHTNSCKNDFVWNNIGILI